MNGYVRRVARKNRYTQKRERETPPSWRTSKSAPPSYYSLHVWSLSAFITNMRIGLFDNMLLFDFSEYLRVPFIPCIVEVLTDILTTRKKKIGGISGISQSRIVHLLSSQQSYTLFLPSLFSSFLFLSLAISSTAHHQREETYVEYRISFSLKTRLHVQKFYGREQQIQSDKSYRQTSSLPYLFQVQQSYINFTSSRDFELTGNCRAAFFWYLSEKDIYTLKTPYRYGSATEL